MFRVRQHVILALSSITTICIRGSHKTIEFKAIDNTWPEKVEN